jgi:equilibrative nucleoside transporter 1/2/3
MSDLQLRRTCACNGDCQDGEPGHSRHSIPQSHSRVFLFQASKTRRIRATCAALAVLMAALFILTWIPTHPTVFFIFVLANAVSQSIVCSYFSSSVVATSSYFGPFAMQALMTGQAAVAVLISLIQVIVHSVSLGDNPLNRRRRPTEDNSASLFFSFTTAGLVVAFLAHAYLVRLPIYRNVVAPFEMGKVIETEEEEGLMTSTIGSLREIEPVLPVDPRKVSIIFSGDMNLRPVA